MVASLSSKSTFAANRTKTRALAEEVHSSVSCAAVEGNPTAKELDADVMQASSSPV
jgi:hypothetical protein